MPLPASLPTLLTLTDELATIDARHREFAEIFVAIAECAHDIFHGKRIVLPLGQAFGWNFAGRYAAMIARDGSFLLTCSVYGERYETRLLPTGGERRLRQFAVARAFNRRDEAEAWLREVEI